MFFKDIYTWSEKKLFWTRAICWSIYFIFATLIPVIIVLCNYGSIRNKAYAVPKIWLVFIIIVATFGVKKLLQAVQDMDDITPKDQRIKFSIEMIVALIIPAAIGFALFQLETNWDLAKDTIIGCIVSYSAAIVIENVCCKSLDVARRNKKKAKEKIAVDQAAANLKK